MRYFGKARHKSGVMNKTEERYARHLELLKRGGDIVDYFFESVTLKIARDCRYTPDFLVINTKLEIEFHEVKGYWMDDARVKIKVAANKFPFYFLAAKPTRDGWEIEKFRGENEK